MLDDVRNHHPLPTAEEQRWLGFDDVGAIARAMVLAGVALGIGWGASALLDGHTREVTVVYGTTR